MKIRTTILLLILNGVVFFFLMRQESPFEIKDRIGKDDISILPQPMSEATQISVSGSGLETEYVLELEDGQWKLKAPVEWDANTFAVRRIINRLETADVSVRFPVSDILSRDQSLADFGLEEPRITVDVAYGEAVYSYKFGAPVEINDRLYLLAPDQKEILVVKSSTLQPFLVGMDALRSSHLFSIPVFEIQTVLVEFKDDNSRRRFTQIQGDWMIDTPFVSDASDERVKGAIDRLVNYEIDFVNRPEDKDNFPEVSPFNAIARLEIIGNRRNTTLLVSQYIVDGEISPLLYRARLEGSETTFLLPRAEIDWWRNSESQLRERRFFSLDPTKISKFELSRKDEEPSTLRLLKLENDQWRIYSGENTAEPVNYLGDAAYITRKLGDLNSLIVLEFVNDNPSSEELELYGLNQPKMVFEFEGEGATVARLEVGNVDDSDIRVYARTEGSDSVFLVARELVDSLSLNPLNYRSRDVELIGPESDVDYFILRDQQTDHVTNGRSAATIVDSAIQTLSNDDGEAIVAGLRAILRDFRSEGFLTATFDGESIDFDGISIAMPYELKIVSKNPQSKTTNLYLSKRLAGTEQYGWIEDQEMAVRMPQSFIDIIHPLLYATVPPEEYIPPAPGPRVEAEMEEVEAGPTNDDIVEDMIEEPSAVEPVNE